MPKQSPVSEHLEMMRLKVNHYRLPCVGEGVQLCYLVKPEGATAWERFYDAIEGFGAYQWGHVYEILVSREVVRHPAQDASRYRYRLVRILSDEVVPERTTFVLTLSAGDTRPAESGLPAGRFLLVDEVAFTCETEAVCKALAEALRTGRVVQATLRHGRDGVVLVSFVGA